MRSFGGTDTSASRLIAVIVGRIIMDNTITAGSTPGPLKFVENNGNQPNCSCSQLQYGRIKGISTKIPHKPYTTLGTAASSSIMFLSSSSRRSGSFSQRG